MANMASVAYAIEGPQKYLEKIFGSICLAMASNDNRYTEYVILLELGFTEEQLKGKRLGGEISEEPTMQNGVLKFWAEERWGLQDFAECLEVSIPEIKIYWTVEEPGMEIYCTNDKEGKYFPERYWVDMCIDGIYQSEYFQYESSVYKWLHDVTHGSVNSKEKVQRFNEQHENVQDEDENFIYIHEFEIIE